MFEILAALGGGMLLLGLLSPLLYYAGAFNPIGYFGVHPSRVPRCDKCKRMKGVGHYC